MLRIAPRLQSLGPLLPGTEFVPFGVVMISGYLNFLLMVWFLHYGMAPVSTPHMLANAVATPFLFLLVLIWVAFRLLGWVTSDTAVGFGLAGYALAARAMCEFMVWMGEPYVRNAVDCDVPSPLFANLVRFVGAWAYVFGIAVVAASSWRAAMITRRSRRDRSERLCVPRMGIGRLVVSVLLLLVVSWYGYVVVAGAIRLFDLPR